MRRQLIWFLAAWFLLSGVYAPIRTAAWVAGQQDSIRLTDTLPMDTGVRIGRLANGFTFYLRHNAEPKDRVVMYLAVRVGSIIEEEHERGLAHFLEHMQFNGTKHFPKNQLVDYLQRAGVRFGSDLNAYTTYNQTVYKLPIPSDDPELLRNGLLVLRDWAQDALLEGEEIEKERGVVLNELLGSKGAEQRMSDQYTPMVLNQSRYAQRNPIGTKEVLETFDHEALRNFHRKWYRPDQQALIIVGDVDIDSMENQITTLFADLKMPEDAPVRETYRIPLIDQNQFMVVTDPEMTQTVLQAVIKHPESKIGTVGTYRGQLVKQLFNLMLNERFAELGRRPDPPFISGGGSVGGFMEGLDAFALFTVSKPGELQRGFEAVVTEIERVKRYGFGEGELRRAKSDVLKHVESSYAERDKRKSESYVEDYLHHFLKGGNVLSSEDRYRLNRRLLETITLDEVNAVVGQYYVDRNRDIVVLGPERDKGRLPDEETVLGWLAAVRESEIMPYEDVEQEAALVEQLPEPGSVRQRREIPALGVTELVLSNGVTVVLKPTDFKNDDIRMVAYSPGGSSGYSDEDYLNALYAPTVVGSSGVGPFDANQMYKFISGKNVDINLFINERTEGFQASSGQKDVRTMFELIYSFLTAPRIDITVFNGYMQRLKAALANRADDPYAVFGDTINAVLYNNNIRRNSLTVEQVDRIDPARAFEIYRERFADASDFTVTIVGSFKEEEIMPLVLQYIGSLPIVERVDEPVDLGIYPPEKGLRRTVYRGKEQKATVQLYYFGAYNYSEEENLLLDALRNVLENKLRERLREEESGVYNVGVSASYAKVPRERYSIGIGYGTSPEMVDYLLTAAMEEIDKIKTGGPDQVDVDKFVSEQRRGLEVQLRDNGFWLGYLSGMYENKEDISFILRYNDELNKVTPERVKAIANKYLLQDRMFTFVLMPAQ